LRVITFKIDESLLEEIDRLSISFRMCRSEFIRTALKTYVNSCMGGKNSRIRCRRFTLT